MRLSISNIAWHPEEDILVAEILRANSVDAIDVAPGKYFPEPSSATITEIISVRKCWEHRGIEIVGMQALLFGTNGLNVFGSKSSQEKLLIHLESVCRIGANLGAHRLVFGSPKNRDRTGLSDEQANHIACEFFARAAKIAQNEGVYICLEPNPICYGANFMTTSAETATIVTEVNHPAIKMQLDTGAITINNENPANVIDSYAHLIGHIHLSEPNLLPLGDSATDHSVYSNAINNCFNNPIVTVEMLATENEPHIISVERALTYARKYYFRETI